jgi:hypothetical protein
VTVPLFTRTVPVPVTDLLVLGSDAVLLVLLTAAFSLIALRASNDIAELRTA